MCVVIPAAALAAASIAGTVLSAGISMYGAMQSANAASAQAQYKAQQDRNNAILAGRAADDALARGDISAQQKANQTAALLGKQRVGLAANGVDVNQDSGLDLQSDTAAAGTFDQLTIQSNAHREATGYQTQSTNYSNQAALDEAASADALNGGALKTAAAGIGGIGAVAGQWYNFNYGTRQSSVTGRV